MVQKNLHKIPHPIGAYGGVDICLHVAVVNELNGDVFLYRDYINRSGDVLNLYIGYYGTMKGGRTGHNPSACHPGSGWAIVRQSNVESVVSLDGMERLIKLNRMEVRKGTPQNSCTIGISATMVKYCLMA
jgi:EpsI family protein